MSISTSNSVVTDPTQIGEVAKSLGRLVNNKNINPSALKIEKNISIFELEDCLGEAKSKIPGYDIISYKMTQSLDPSSKNRLLSLYKNNFKTGVIPSTWKTATIVPIQKHGKDMSNITSYCPISSHSCVSKFLEKIILTRLSWFAEQNNIIARKQVAFKSGSGIRTVILGKSPIYPVNSF